MQDAAVRGQGQVADRSATARMLRGQLETLRSTWQQLIADQTRGPETLPPDILDACLNALADFIEQPDIAIPARAGTLWQQHFSRTRELIATAAVATGLLGEALRTGVELSEGDRHVLKAMLPEFSGSFVRGMFVTPEMSAGEQHWYEVSRQLSEERERRITQLGILNEVSAALSSTLSLPELYEIIYEQCGRLVDTSYFYIGTIGPESGMMTLGLVYMAGERKPDLENRPIPMGLARLVADTDAPVVVDDYVTACRERGITPSVVMEGSPLAWVGVPIVANSVTIGLMAVMSPTSQYDEDAVETIAAVARQAGAAIQNAYLYEAQIIQANQLKATNQLARAIASIREPLPLMRVAATLIHDLFGYSSVAIFVARPDVGQLVMRAQRGIEGGESLLGLTLTIGGMGLVSHAAASNEVTLVNDVSSDPRYVTSPQTASTRSEIALPLLRDGSLLGVLDIQSPEVNAYSERDVEILTTLADQLAIALENAELFLRESRRRSELALMLKVSQAANSSLLLDNVLQHVAEGLCDAVQLPTCVIYLYDEEADRLLPAAYVAREGSRLDTSRVSHFIPSAAASELLERVLQVDGEARTLDVECCDVGHEIGQLLATNRVLAVPFVVKQRVLGLALIASHDESHRFSPGQERLACGVASTAALALENARLYARSHTLGVAEERIRIARDIHDGIAQGLTAITLQLEAADQMFAAKPEKSRAKISRALELTRLNLEDARRSVLDLRASALQELTLTEALERRMLQFNAEHRERGLDGTFSGSGMHGRLSSRVELSLYRVYEEALDNVARHSGATHVDASLTREGDTVMLRVRDNGHGFDTATALGGAQPVSGFGLVAIRERIRLLHGTFSVESGAANGTHGAQLTVSVPFEPHVESVERGGKPLTTGSRMAAAGGSTEELGRSAG